MLKLLSHFLSCIYWSRQPVEKVRAMQLKKFKEIFEYAREHSKFYHALYEEARILDLEIKSWDDIQKIPVVTKKMMRKVSPEDLVTEPFDESKHSVLMTSGSSGMPFRVLAEKWVAYTGHVRLLWIMMRHGYNPFKKVTYLCRFDEKHTFDIEKKFWVLKLLQNYFRLFRKSVVSVFLTPGDIIDRLKKDPPDVLWAPVSAVSLVVEELERQDDKLQIPLMVIYAETHTSLQEKKFKERLCINLIDVYGCEEIPSMAVSYNQSSYKEVVSNFVLMEIQNKRSLGTDLVGDLVATNLLNNVMPFIRYDLGDSIGVLDTADFLVKRIGNVYGRTDDIIELPNGQDIYFSRVYRWFADFSHVDQYKVFQCKDGQIEFWIKVRDGVEREVALMLAKKKWAEGWPGLDVKCLVKDDLGIDARTGKFKVIERER